MTSSNASRRIDREKRIIAQMVRFYCHAHHSTAPHHLFSRCTSQALCPECSELLAYSHARLSRCPQAAHKPSCRRCAIHCYSPAMRERIRIVMKSVGPRMLFVSPIAAIRHLLSEFR